MAFLPFAPVKATTFTSKRPSSTCRTSPQRVPLLNLVPSCSLSPPPPKSPQQDKPTVPTSRPEPQRLSNTQVFFERLGDTFTDVRIHYSRQFSARPPPSSKQDGIRVVVLGSGWGAHSLVKVIDMSPVQSVTVISPRNFFFFTPLLSATAVGTIEFRSIVEPIRKANPLVSYFEAVATSIDHKGQTVHCVRDKNEIELIGGGVEERDTSGSGNNNQIQFDVPYDVLVVAVGETTATFNVPGAREYAFFLKEITDARRLRANLLECLERASLPVWSDKQRRDLLHFVVVGGGPTGCEFAGELSDFVSKDLAPRYGKEFVSQIEVTLLQSGKSLLNQFESSLQEVALKTFEGRVDVQFDARVSAVDATHVHLQSGESIAYGVLVWAAGNATRPVVKQLLKDTGAPEKARKLPVDQWMRVENTKGMFALGDCAQMTAEPLPSTAQVAGQQGAYLARLISKCEPESLDLEQVPVLKDSGGKVLHPFRFLSLGIMAYLGNDRAVVQVEATKSKNLLLGGRIAYALWRSVYAVKQVDVRNRLLVLFDYFKSRVYGRDISQF